MDRDAIRRILEAKKRDIEAKISAASGSETLARKDTRSSNFSDDISVHSTLPFSPSASSTSQLPQYDGDPPVVKQETRPSSVSGAFEPTTSVQASIAPKARKSRWAPAEEKAGISNIVFPPVFTPDPSAIQLNQLKIQLAAKDHLLKAKAGVVDAEIGIPSREHLQRALEMEKTKGEAAKLTVNLHLGGHHMQDFIPPEVMAQFTKRPEPGVPSSAVPQYEENKLDESNKGFQMLKKFGWSEGKGLGMAGTGIAAPISNVAPVERAGLGVKRPNEPSAEDDEFELYRKRMMTAYKYRPNPLNNPRRPYY